ncbi:lipoate--protein ligase [Salinicoccus halodurans]|uniref:lipoate--protein ligase n=1 Tax=Salinicoccus halodurans TaxID=407035 RepID=A0A0F7HM15_9STAP|nr:lipoate--protein ligase [Salinicoccus halodurans]AKG74424.1 lipoate--protein ligase [Salinicoccus halodurans]SFK95859.1 lipoate-protein ligase [Salinicoccus halodurans]
MKFISNNNITDPMINLAMEEYVLREIPTDDSYFLFYVNQPSIIIGKNQNTIEEINETYIREHGIKVVRRVSGGGAVYHDEGNLNFSFITEDDGNSFHNFRKFTQPIVDALNDMGIPAELSGRNDLEINGKKVSGNAMFSQRGRMFSHGTLMLDSDISEVQNALKVNPKKIESKGVKSVRGRVGNINDFLEEKIDIEEFKRKILEYIFDGEENIEEYVLTDEDWEKINKLSAEKYQTWEWNYGKNPKYNFNVSHKFPAGLLDVRLDVKKGRIEHAKIFGDFFGVGEIDVIEEKLIGVEHNREAIAEALKDVDISHYLGRITREELLELVA